ncbi:MAG: UDP-glucose 4-epimerase [Gaiellales bacterium]|nr:UDP-glucose 4-epimerase [Gaiellales bacterium]
MRVVVFGATGNVGMSLMDLLRQDPDVDELHGVARRPPVGGRNDDRVTWSAADIRRDDLVPIVRGADVVVHLAWAIQPSHDPESLYQTNVAGSRRVFDAVADARVPALVYASSVGTYARGPKNRAVDETWPATGIKTSFYSRHKAAVETMLNVFEWDLPAVRVVRLRPGLIFKRRSGAEQASLFLGPLFPRALADPRRIPVVPSHPRLRFQAVHTDDVADAYRRAIAGDVHGPFNVAADPVIDSRELARLLHARAVPVPAAAMRAAVRASWRLHLQPTPPGWVDMGLGVPIMDCSRAGKRLGWRPERTSTEALLDVLGGIRDDAREETPAMTAPG